MDSHEDHLYGGPTVNKPCRRCKGEFGSRRKCRNCGRDKDRHLLSRNRARRRKIGGKRGRNSGKVSQHGKK